MERRAAIFGLRVNLRVRVKQQRQCVGVAVLRSEVQRGPAVPVSPSHVRLPLQQQPHYLRLACNTKYLQLSALNSHPVFFS